MQKPWWRRLWDNPLWACSKCSKGWESVCSYFSYKCCQTEKGFFFFGSVTFPTSWSKIGPLRSSWMCQLGGLKTVHWDPILSSEMSFSPLPPLHVSLNKDALCEAIIFMVWEEHPDCFSVLFFCVCAGWKTNSTQRPSSWTALLRYPKKKKWSNEHLLGWLEVAVGFVSLLEQN